MNILLIKDNTILERIREVAKETFISMAKAVVDVRKEIIAVGGELHADAEAELIKSGSNQDDLWGINIYPDKTLDNRIEYISLINIRPSKGNKTMDVEDSVIREKIKTIVNKLIGP